MAADDMLETGQNRRPSRGVKSLAGTLLANARQQLPLGPFWTNWSRVEAMTAPAPFPRHVTEIGQEAAFMTKGVRYGEGPLCPL